MDEDEYMTDEQDFDDSYEELDSDESENGGEDEETDEEDEEVIETKKNRKKGKKVGDQTRISIRKLTQYEYARVIWTRINHLGEGFKSFLDESEAMEIMDSHLIAQKEFNEGLLDDVYTIERNVSNTVEFFKVGELRDRNSKEKYFEWFNEKFN